nr:DUF6064 family protein [uncultured Macellibacteroides sp.]
MNTFWKTIAVYNSATWFYQIIIVLIGVFLTLMLLRNPQRWVKRGMKIYFFGTSLWISVVYYHIYCSERTYNNVLSIFWAILAVAWLWDLLTDHTQLERNPKYNVLGYLLLLMPFIYPIFSTLRGLNFPGITSPVMPCSVVTFTIGMLLLFSKKTNLFIILLLSHWSLIGLSKTFFFKIPEDFLLASASVPALYLFFKEYFLSNLHMDTNPKAKYINWLLVSVCVAIGIILMTTLVIELSKDA